MARALGAADWSGLGQLVRRLKGSGGSFGYPELTTLGAEIERLARANDYQGRRCTLAALRDIGEEMALT